VAAIVILYFNYRISVIRKKEAEKAETNTKMAELEQMALRSQMNPHFIFNCLNSIQQYILYKDALGANEFITKFAYLIRQTLDISARPSISLDEEINYIGTYMALEKKRFDDKFIYEIVVDGEVDRSQCHIPPMILQPYIENAVRHGIGLRKDNEGRLLVRMQYREGYLVCIVEDNGVGREMAGMYKSVNSIAYQSVGMSLVAKRIEMLNKTSRSPVKIRIDDLKDAGGLALGTRINLFFPLDIALNE
jgi:LytS/YehU family sensor histidine kinase